MKDHPPEWIDSSGLILAMPRILISYRRSDSSAIAGRILDRLVAKYGHDSVFMDIENIPFGIDFRKHIQSTVLRTDVLLVVVGPQWMGPQQTGRTRIAEATDPVRVEVEMALDRAVPVIPILIDRTKMPESDELPESLRAFAYLNAAEVATGRDFHIHMDRLIGAIDHATIAGPDSTTSYAVPVNAVASSRSLTRNGMATSSNPSAWADCLLRYLGFPVVVLLVAHHLIVNSLNLDIGYLRAASFVVPFCFGFFLYWRDRRSSRAAIMLGTAVGLVAVTGMTVSESLNSGDSILPTTSYEWRENIEYAVSIGLCFIAAHLFARMIHPRLANKGDSHISR